MFIIRMDDSVCRLDVLRRGNVYLHFKDLKLLQHDDLKFCSKATVRAGLLTLGRVGFRVGYG